MRSLVTTAAALLMTPSLAAAQAPGAVLLDPPLPRPASGARMGDPVDVAVDAPAPAQRISYRNQIAVADAVSVTAIVLGPAISRDASITLVGMTSYFLTAPVIHALHGRGAAAGKSLALRVGLPMATGYLAYALGPSTTACAADIDGGGGGCSDQGSAMLGVAGFIAGGIAAMYLDGKYLARHERRTTPTWSAGLAPTQGGASLGIAGSF